MLDERYIVTDKKKGLLVTNYVFKAGRTFVKEQWKWGDEALEAAIKAGRCKLEGDKEKKKEKKKEVSGKDDNNEGQNLTKKEKAKKEKELEKMIAEYGDLDPESEEAKELLEKITELEGELK